MSNPQRLHSPDAPGNRYRNPILYADFSDPDAIRVGENYYMVASSFSNAPALPILHSRDLVHWRLVNYALKRLPGDHFDKPCHGAGVWAPALRYHGGKYWIFFPMPDEGIYVTTADDPLGDWRAPWLIKPARGWIDPCPFWDENGDAWLVSAFAKSRSGIKSKLNLAPMRPDGSALLGEGEIIFDGTDTQPTIEGPKLYKRNGYYYILAPAGGVPHGWQTALRARDIRGPYEQKIVMMRGESAVNGPHQGALVESADGKSWFLHFQDVGVCGRVVHLQPVRWENDWPVIGQEHDGEGWGEPVAEWEAPAASTSRLPDADEHRFGLPSLAWQWNANGREEWLTLGAEGFCLHAQAWDGCLCDLPSLLLHRFEAEAFQTTAVLEALDDGATAGMIALGRQYGAMLLCRQGETVLVAYVQGTIGGQERRDSLGEIRYGEGMRLTLAFSAGQCRFLLENGEARLSSPAFDGSPGVWTGEKYGLFCLGGEGELRVRRVDGA